MQDSHLIKCRGFQNGKPCESTVLIKSHIIAECFMRHIRDDNGDIVVITAEKTKKAYPPLGYYDTKILCADCDGRLGDYDKYGIETCRRSGEIHNTNTEWVLPDVSGDLFAKFILATLWRASISGNANFSKINMGIYEKDAAEVLFGVRLLRHFPAFEVLLKRYHSTMQDTEMFITNIGHDDFQGYNVFSLGIGGFQIMAKLDEKIFPPSFAPYIVNNNHQLRGIYVDMMRTDESRLFKHAVRHRRNTK